MIDANSFTLYFEQIAQWVLGIARLVKEPYVPGLVVSVLLLGLLGAMVLFGLWSYKYLKALKAAKNLISGSVAESSGTDVLRKDFFDRQPKINQGFAALEKKRSRAARRVTFAWREYRETLKEEASAEAMFNGIRPSVFFNTGDLAAEARGWRIIPALFVSIGLAATFLGLIAALQQTGETLAIPVTAALSESTSAGPTSALQLLLTIASAKFIMSLTGLMCSIVFTVFLRWQLGRVEEAIDRLCICIEKRVVFLALESLAFDQRRLMEEQKEHSQKLNTELIAAIGRSLSDELPKAISGSIAQVMEPIMSQVGQVGSDSVRDMVSNMATQFSDDVSRAMRDAADRFDAAAHRIESLADALRSNLSEANGSMDESVTELARTIREMREGMVEGANATNAAFQNGASAMLDKLDGSLGSIQAAIVSSTQEQAGTMEQLRRGLIADANATTSTFQDGASSMTGKLNESVAKMQATIVHSAELQKASVERIDAATQHFTDMLATAGADASVTASERFNELNAKASKDMMDALGSILQSADVLSKESAERLLGPIQNVSSSLGGFVARIEQGTKRFGDLSEAISDGAEAATKHAGVVNEASSSLRLAAEPVSALARGLSSSAHATAEAAVGIAGSLKGQREIVERSLQAISESLEQFQDVIERYDEIDEKLNDAFGKFRDEVSGSLESLSDYSGKVHETYGDALSKLQSVVDQAVDFSPVSKA